MCILQNDTHAAKMKDEADDNIYNVRIDPRKSYAYITSWSIHPECFGNAFFPESSRG